MEEKPPLNLKKFLEKAKKRTHKYRREPFDAATFRNYQKFSNLEEHRDYYEQVKVCKAILSDIKNSSPFVLKMEQYCPGIEELTIDDVLKIRYHAERESYIIYADGHQYEIYEDDIRFIYPSIADVPDSYEFEAVIEDSSVYVYHRFTNELPFRVYPLAEAAEE